MDSKIKFFVILMFFFLISLNTASAYTAYINIYIVNLSTNAGEADPIKLVDVAASPIQWKVTGTGCTPTSYTDDIANGQYGDGDTITTGSPATLTEGSACMLYLQVDEVRVGSYYYGSCTTATTSSICTTCAGGGSACPAEYASTWLGAPTNAYSYSYLQAATAAGNTGVCNMDSNFGSCSDEIVTQLDDAATTEFTFSFTA